MRNLARTILFVITVAVTVCSVFMLGVMAGSAMARSRSEAEFFVARENYNALVERNSQLQVELHDTKLELERLRSLVW